MKHPYCIPPLALLFLGPLAHADLIVETYQPNRQDRFYVGADKAFLGQAFNWSGVGQTSGNNWATMISPSYFVSSAHDHPAPGQTLTFYSDNTTNHPHTYTVSSFGYTTTYPGGTSSDLWLGELTAPIPAADHITSYPVLSLASNSKYVGLEIYVNGLPDRVGRNIVNFVGPVNDSGQFTQSMEYDYSAVGVGPDEAYLNNGDSGGPTFTNSNGTLALLGIHFGRYTAFPISVDSFVPYYVPQLDAHMAAEQVLVILPEPPVLPLFALALIPLLTCRRRA